MLLKSPKFFLLVSLLIAGKCAVAQTTASYSDPLSGRENNPYSMYGIGDLRNSSNAVIRGMGNASSAFADGYRVNADNPASYSWLQRTTFEAGAWGGSRTITGILNGVEKKYQTGTATIAYMNVAFPINKKGGFVIGFKPYSNTYYKMSDTIGVGGIYSPISKAERTYEGNGSTNHAYIGGSWRHKGFSIGLNVGYLFGSVNKLAYLQPLGDSAYDTRIFKPVYTNYTRIGGIMWKAGLMYEGKLDSTHYYRIGGTFSSDQKMNQHLSRYTVAFNNFSDTIVRDTSVNLTESAGTMTMPMQYSIGLMVGKLNKWDISVDYTTTKWANFKSSPDSTLKRGLSDASYRLSLGGSFTPEFENTRNYFAKCTYRLGAHYGQTNLALQSQNIMQWGATAGMGLPLRKSMSQLQLAIEYGQLGTNNNGLMKQSYLQFTAGLSLNDIWFVKRKYD